jgi:hypothetical protein
MTARYNSWERDINVEGPGEYNTDPIPDIKPDAINAMQQSDVTVKVNTPPMAKVVLVMPVDDALWLRQTLHENRIEGSANRSRYGNSTRITNWRCTLRRL